MILFSEDEIRDLQTLFVREAHFGATPEGHLLGSPRWATVLFACPASPRFSHRRRGCFSLAFGHASLAESTQWGFRTCFL